MTSDSRQQRRQAAYCRLTLVNTLSARWQAGPVAPNGEECEVERIFELENIIMYHLTPHTSHYVAASFVLSIICYVMCNIGYSPALIMIKH